MVNSYTDTPIASHTLAADQPRIEANFLYLANTLGTSQPNKAGGTGSGDHQISTSGTDATQFEGRHVQVSLKDRSNTNLSMPGDGTDSLVWSSGGNLFWKNTTIASGVQLTSSNTTPTASTNGKSILPGGMIIQWGSAGATADGTPVTFALAFPTNLFSLTVSHSATGAAENPANVVSAINKTTTGFTFRTTTANSSYSYIAIGN